MAWIELHQTVASNRKILYLKRLLKIRPSHVVGHLCFLWLWALDNAKDGDLSGIPVGVIAQAADYNPRKAAEFVDALVCAGLLDRDGDALRIHDWQDYGGRLQESRRRAAERKRRYRARQPEGTGTSADVPCIHYTTQPDTTQPDTTQQFLSSGAGGGKAHGPAQAGAFLDGQGLESRAYEQASPEMRRRSDDLTTELFQTFCSRTPTLLDRVRVFTALSGGGAAGSPDGGDPGGGRDDRADLLRYAFQQAAQAGRPGVWPYIEGVLGRLHQRGIRDLTAAEDYDWERNRL